MADPQSAKQVDSTDRLPLAFKDHLLRFTMKKYGKIVLLGLYSCQMFLQEDVTVVEGKVTKIIVKEGHGDYPEKGHIVTVHCISISKEFNTCTQFI